VEEAVIRFILFVLMLFLIMSVWPILLLVGAVWLAWTITHPRRA
jgi:hypothetical protein